MHIFLGTGDPVDPSPVQIEQMGKVEITLVEYDDFACVNGSAEFAGPAVVMFAGSVHDHALRQKTLQVQAQMGFGRSFAAAVLGPSWPGTSRSMAASRSWASLSNRRHPKRNGRSHRNPAKRHKQRSREEPRSGNDWDA